MAITGIAGAFWGPAKDDNGFMKDSVPFDKEPLVGQTDYQTYLSPDSQKRYWDREETVVVEVSIDGAPWEVAKRGFVVQHAGGIVYFREPDETRRVRVSGAYFEMEEKLGFYSWRLTVDVATHDASDFQSDRWTENITGNRSWTAEADQYWRSDERLDDWIGRLLPVTFYVSDKANTKYRYEGTGYVNQEVLTVPQGELITKSLRFTGDGGVWRRAYLVPAWDAGGIVLGDRELDADDEVAGFATDGSWLIRLLDQYPTMIPGP